MKKLQILAFGLITTTGFAATEETPAIICGTGDSLAGVDVYINQLTGESKVVLLSQADPPEGKDLTYTFTLDMAQGDALKAGQQVTVTARSPDSFDFGGSTSHAVLFNLKVNTEVFSFDRNSQLAEGGSVFHLFCNKAGLVPPPR